MLLSRQFGAPRHAMCSFRPAAEVKEALQAVRALFS